MNSETLQAVTRDISSLAHLRTRDLVRRYEEIFGAPPRSHNARWLRKRIAFRLQEIAEGGLSDRAQLRIAELGDGLPFRWRERLARAASAAAAASAATPRVTAAAGESAPKRACASGRDLRLPPPGSVLRRIHDGVEHEVVVRDVGFEYRGGAFGNLSHIAKLITGTSWNGYLFFGLQQRRRKKES